MKGKRTERVARLIQNEISKIIQQDINNPKVGFVTVMGVTLSSDLKHAKVFVSIYGDKKSKQQTMKALVKSIYFIKKEIAARIKLRHVPEIHFCNDETAEQIAHISEIFNRIHKEAAGVQDTDN